MLIHCLQHVPFEGPFGIADWAAARGHALRLTPLYDGVAPPEPADFDWLVIMGGPMGVGDEGRYPWLAAEKDSIRRGIAAGKTLVGVCLGAQLLAEALGARVYRHREREIGWMPIDLTAAGQASPVFGFLPLSLPVFHWHGDTFEPPASAVPFGPQRGLRAAGLPVRGAGAGPPVPSGVHPGERRGHLRRLRR